MKIDVEKALPGCVQVKTEPLIWHRIAPLTLGGLFFKKRRAEDTATPAAANGEQDGGRMLLYDIRGSKQYLSECDELCRVQVPICP